MSLQMNVYDGKLFKPYVEILHLLEGMGCMCVCVGGGGVQPYHKRSAEDAALTLKRNDLVPELSGGDALSRLQHVTQISNVTQTETKKK